MFKKIFTTFLILAALLIAGQTSAATNFSFYPLKINVKEGQTFKVSVSANPNGVKNYTVKMSVKFPPELVKLNTWDFGEDWMPLRKAGYDSFDNTAGTLVRTAGYPEGFDTATNFGTAVFIAKKTGSGIIEFSGEQLALDENSGNVYAGGNKVNVTVQEIKAKLPATTTTSAEAEPPNGEQSPEQLFYINLEIDEYQVADIADLTSRVVFMSFGKVPTPVDLTFDILDGSGNVVHSEKDSVTVETEKVFIKQFSEVALSPGAYTLRLTTLYNISVRDEFTQPFEVSQKDAASVSYWWIWTLAGIAALTLLIAFILKRRSRNKTKAQ